MQIDRNCDNSRMKWTLFLFNHHWMRRQDARSASWMCDSTHRHDHAEAWGCVTWKFAALLCDFFWNGKKFEMEKNLKWKKFEMEKNLKWKKIWNLICEMKEKCWVYTSKVISVGCDEELMQTGCVRSWREKVQNVLLYTHSNGRRKLGRIIIMLMADRPLYYIGSGPIRKRWK